jgi:hypothetical protein
MVLGVMLKAAAEGGESCEAIMTSNSAASLSIGLFPGGNGECTRTALPTGGIIFAVLTAFISRFGRREQR